MKRFLLIMTVLLISTWRYGSFLLIATTTFAQQSPPVVYQPQLISFPGIPTGTCDIYQVALNTATGDYYTCQLPGRTWFRLGNVAGNPAGPANIIQKSNSAVTQFIASSATDDAGGFHFKGPNPYADVLRYGVRAVNPNIIPAAVGITSTCTNGQTLVVVSTASTFQNGDGVRLNGCGAPHSMTTPSAPTITPSVSRVMTGVFDVVNSPAGATSYSYKIVARDKAGGLTAASVAGTTATGQASLGAQSVSISSASRSNGTNSFVTSSAHTLSVNAMVYINVTVGDTSFGGWYQVVSTADNTHFTVSTGLDTRNGANSATVGTFTATANWFNCNHVTWTSVTGAYLYYIYGRIGGSEVLLDVSWPVNGAFTNGGDGTLAWDDFGATMMGNITSLPDYVPTNPPVSATSDNLVTTITAGAGTTSLVLAAAAGTSVSGTTIRFDNAPNILTALTNNQNNPVQFPIDANGNSYVINSLLDLSSINSIFIIPGSLYLNDTVVFGQFAKIIGSTTPVSGSGSSFQFESLPSITCNAIPCIHETNGNWSPYMEGVQVIGTGNGNLLIVHDFGTAGGAAKYNRVNFATGQGANDYMGIGWVGRQTTVSMDRVLFISGPSQVNGVSATPNMYCDECSELRLGQIFFSRRSLLLRPVASGGFLSIQRLYEQGGIIPVITLAGRLVGGGASAVVDLQHMIEDTMAHPLITYLPSVGSLSGGVKALIDIGPSSSNPVFSGSFSVGNLGGFGLQLDGLYNTVGPNVGISTYAPSGVAFDSVFSSSSLNNSSYTTRIENGALSTGPAYPIFVSAPPPAITSAVINAGGNISIGAHTAQIVPVWSGTGFGTESLPSQTVGFTTSNGNQSVTVNWPAIPGNPLGVRVFIDGLMQKDNGTSGCPYTPITGTSYTITNITSCGIALPTVAAGGPTMLMPGVQGIATPALIVGGNSFAPTYTTISATTGASIGTTTMTTASASGSKYVFNISATQVAGGTSCTGNSTLAVNVTYTDAVTGNSSTPSPGAYSFANTSFAGNNIPVLAVNNGVANTHAIEWMPLAINAKASTTVSYSTTYTAGANCSPAPTYYVNPVLIQVQ